MLPRDVVDYLVDFSLESLAVKLYSACTHVWDAILPLSFLVNHIIFLAIFSVTQSHLLTAICRPLKLDIAKVMDSFLLEL